MSSFITKFSFLQQITLTFIYNISHANSQLKKRENADSFEYLSIGMICTLVTILSGNLPSTCFWIPQRENATTRAGALSL